MYGSLIYLSRQFHHANISWGKANISWGKVDPLLRWLFVTPDMHKIHHSRLSRELNSKDSTFFSCRDRLAGTFQMRPHLETMISGSLNTMIRTGRHCRVCGKPRLAPHRHNRHPLIGKVPQIDLSDVLFSRIGVPQPILNIRFCSLSLGKATVPGYTSASPWICLYQIQDDLVGLSE